MSLQCGSVGPVENKTIIAFNFALVPHRWKANDNLTKWIPSLPMSCMDEILQTVFPNVFFFRENYCILIKISQKFVPFDLIYNQSALV